MVFTVAENRIILAHQRYQSSRVRGESGRKQHSGFCSFKCGDDVFKFLMQRTSPGDQCARSRPRLHGRGFRERSHDSRVTSQSEVVVGGETEAALTVDDALCSADRFHAATHSSLVGDVKSLQRGGKSLMNSFVVHGVNCSGRKYKHDAQASGKPPHHSLARRACKKRAPTLHQSNSMLTELFAARFGDQVVVFKPHSALAFDITAGFESDDVADDQHVVAF